MFSPYLQAFSRLTIGLVFALAFAGKARDVQSFAQTIERFRILPGALSCIAACAFLTGELLVITAMLLGRTFLLWGFILAGLMLTAFCVALASVLFRRIQTPCNCFGASEKPASRYDILRNTGFIACALGGCFVTSTEPGGLTSLSVLEWWLTGMAALAFVMVSTQLGEIVAMFR